MHHFCFFRFGREEHLDDLVEDMVVMRFTTIGLVSREKAFERFLEVLKDWTENTEAGRAALAESRNDFNIGDYLLVQKNYELRQALERANLHVEELYTLQSEHADVYDRILAGPNAGEEPDEEG